MALALSSIDLYFVAKELQMFVGGVVDKTFTDGTNIFMRMYVRGQGKLFLNIGPKYVWQSDKKPGPSQANGFNEYLRRYFSRATLTAITHVPGERILKFTFQKEEILHWYVELFGSGNIVIVETDNTIKNCFSRQTMQNRTIKPGLPYPTEGKDDLFSTTHDKLIQELIASSDPASKVLAGYGGRKWAEEICLRAHVKPDKAVATSAEAEHIASVIREIKDAHLQPQVYLKDDKPYDVSPFPLEQYTGAQPVETMLLAYAKDYTPPVIEDVQDKKLATITSRIEIQEERKDQLLKSADDATAKGELIYQHYQEVAEILQAIKAAREKLTWAEIKDRLKDHPIVKKIDEKNGKIHIEL